MSNNGFTDNLLGGLILSGMFYVADRMARKSERLAVVSEIQEDIRDWELKKLKEELEALRKSR